MKGLYNEKLHSKIAVSNKKPGILLWPGYIFFVIWPFLTNFLELWRTFFKTTSSFWRTFFLNKLRLKCNYFRFNLRSNLEQWELWSSASLRSAMCFIFASISVQLWSKNARASTSLGSATCFIFASISVQHSNLEQKCESFGLASLGHMLYFRFNLRLN